MTPLVRNSLHSFLSAALSAAILLAAFLSGAVHYEGPKRFSSFGPANCWVVFGNPWEFSLLVALPPTLLVAGIMIATATFSKNEVRARLCAVLTLPVACLTYFAAALFLRLPVDY